MIFVECNPDKTLVRFALPNLHKHQIGHLGTIAEVVKMVRKKTAFRGLIDEDPFGTHPGYLDEFSERGESGSFLVWKHSRGGGILVVFPSRLENWLIRAAREARVYMTEFGLSDDPNDLHGQISSSQTRSQEKLKRLLEALVRKKSGFLHDIQTALSQ